jgi:hypothetical protein
VDRFHAHTARAAAEATFAPIPPRMSKIHSHNPLIIIISIIEGGGVETPFTYTTIVIILHHRSHFTVAA